MIIMIIILFLLLLLLLTITITIIIIIIILSSMAFICFHSMSFFLLCMSCPGPAGALLRIVQAPAMHSSDAIE